MIDHFIFSDMNSWGTMGAALLSFFVGFFFFILLIAIGFYVYTSFAYMRIGQKAKEKDAWLAWVPVVGKPLLTAKIAKMHWWPVLLLSAVVLTFIPVVGIFLQYAAFITFTVFFYIWRWKTYEKVGQPGWFALFFLLPLVGHIFLGIVAWSKENIIEPVKKKKK